MSGLAPFSQARVTSPTILTRRLRANQTRVKISVSSKTLAGMEYQRGGRDERTCSIVFQTTPFPQPERRGRVGRLQYDNVARRPGHYADARGSGPANTRLAGA